MRTEHPIADRCAVALAQFPINDVLRLASDRADTPWLPRAVASGAPVEDKGLFWVVLPGDECIWPVRVFIASLVSERHAVWFTYDHTRLGAEFLVETQLSDWVNPDQAGEPGRTRLLSRPGAPGSLSPASRAGA